MNESGNATLFGLIVIMTFTMMALYLVKKRVDYTTSTEDFQKLLLCTKETNGVTKLFFDRISDSNAVLKALTITEYSSTAIPIYGAIASKTASQAIEVTKRVQLGYLLSYLNKLRELRQKKCYISPNIYKTPFELALTAGFERNQFEEAKLRGDTWKYINLGNNKFIQTKLQLNPTWTIQSSLQSLALPF